jgi:hypothetical protein
MLFHHDKSPQHPSQEEKKINVEKIKSNIIHPQKKKKIGIDPSTGDDRRWRVPRDLWLSCYMYILAYI